MFGLSNLWLYGIVAAAVLGIVGVQQYRVNSAHTETAEAKLELSDLRAAIADERAAFEANARKAERESDERMAALAETTKQEMQDAQDKADRTIADLSAGNLKLRQHWQAAIATAELSATIGSAAVSDGDADLRRADIGRVLGIVGQCQAHVRGLQAVVRSDRGQSAQQLIKE